MQPIDFFYFLSTFVKSNLTHLTTDMMLSGQHFATLAMFYEWIPLSQAVAFDSDLQRHKFNIIE